jgi:hypothetical protein
MFIAVRQGKDGSWIIVSEHAPDRSSDAPPTVVPVGQIVELIPGLRVSVEGFELPGSRVIDIVGVDGRGDIVLALTRLAQSTEIRQVCVSRLLELAAQLRRDLTFKEFEARLEAVKGRPLDELVLESLPEAERRSFDSRAFRLRLAQNLEQGRFRLVLAVDRVTDDLESFLDYLRHSSEGMIRFEPVELATFDVAGSRIMVPRVNPKPFAVFPIAEDGREDADDETKGRGSSVFDLDALSADEAIPEDLADALGQMSADSDRSDPLFQIYEDLRKSTFAKGDTTSDDLDAEEAQELALRLSAARRDEDAFFQALMQSCTRESHRRARRIAQLGREPSRTLPAGWIVSNTVMSFQAGFFRPGTSSLEPQVAEIFRLQCDGCLVIDPPLLRSILPAAQMETLARDLSSNGLLGPAVARPESRFVIHLDQAFRSDPEVRLFCIGIRKLILGLGVLGSGNTEERDAA